eukprot:CAMPEP_0170513292 /NCGR_PEP_ID=MMETSP0208-20121228/67323_1 /TAXON_ID=197538 /ORGANISM="Strombidium inclinatum, Strain S3" /LENGTH=118 /DNA_ID=CAMNT_0010797015 /DNA_START=746 /DNA_END=1102 /DNA_ORIENTATION=-
MPKQNIHTATNGLDGYQKAIGGGNFDIIIMDLDMPIMDGFEATKKIKAYFQESGLFISDFDQDQESLAIGSSQDSNYMIGQSCPYIVALSGSELDKQLVKRLKHAGFDDWFTNPISAE